MRRKAWGGILAATGFIACPCHLPLTLPLLLGVLGGTGVGSFIGANTGLVYGLATGYFIVGLGAGWYLLKRKQVAQGAACDLPAQVNVHNKRHASGRMRERIGREA